MQKRICLIHNDSRLSKLIDEKLSHLGFEIMHFSSGEEFLEQHLKGLPALYLVNERLPGIQGIDLVKRIRKSSSLVPIIILANTEEENIIHMLKAGADDYQTHPIQFDELSAKIQARWDKFTVLRNVEISL